MSESSKMVSADPMHSPDWGSVLPGRTAPEREDIARVASLPLPWEKLQGKTLVISGGTGFIGSYLLDVIRYRNIAFGNDIRVLSLSRRGGSENVVSSTDKAAVQFIKADINDPSVIDKVQQALPDDSHVDYVLHLASNTHPAQYSSDPVGTITANIFGCNYLLKLSSLQPACRFLLASSVEIYGQGTEAPMTESYSGYIDCNRARSGYNEAKRTCEALCQSYRQQFGVECVIARLSRVFGADRKADSKAMSQFMDKAVCGEDIVLKSKGSQRFSYCYALDAVSGLLQVLLCGKDGEAYNVSDDDDGLTLGGYAEFMASLAGRSVVYDIQDVQGASAASYALLNTSKLQALGWKPLWSVQEGLKRTYEILKLLK